MPDLLTLIRHFRARLLRRDEQARRQIVAAYGQAYKRIKRNLDTLLLDIAKKREAGSDISIGRLAERERLTAILAQIEAEINKFSRRAEGIITSAQEDVINRALKDAPALIRAATLQASFNTIPRGAMESLIGSLSEGSPLSDLLGQLGPQARQAVEQALSAGLLQGQSINGIAREMREAFGGNLTRAKTIARTEIIRSYRAASLEIYRQNRDILRGWMWTCSLGPRSCAACFAMHGTEHTMDETLDDHVNGRCTMIPITRDGYLPQVQSGQEAFDSLTTEQKQTILGKAGYAAYSRGEVRLRDFVGVHTDARWGTMRYQKPFSRVGT